MVLVLDVPDTLEPDVCSAQQTARRAIPVQKVFSRADVVRDAEPETSPQGVAAGEKSTDVAAFLRLLHPPGSVFEIRIFNTPEKKGQSFTATASGYFDDYQKAASEIRHWEKKAEPEGIYTTINPVQKGLKAKAANRLKFKAKHATAGKNITARHCIFIDIDSVREDDISGISATDDEVKRAIEVSRNLREWLTEQGWPAPIRGMSGNGAYILYRCELPNDEAAKDLISNLLKALARRFDTTGAHVDTQTFDANRVCKVLGTPARKGDPLDERPHRRSFYIVPEGELEVVAREQIEAIVAMDEPADSPATAESPKQATVVGGCAPANSRTVERYRRYVAKMALAVEGQGGSNKTLEVGATAARFGLSIDDAWPVMQEFNQRCLPPWDEPGLRRKLEQGHAKAIADGEWATKVLDDQRLADPPASPAAAEGSPTRDVTFAEGMRVRAGDRGNVGTIEAVYADACDVKFVSPQGTTRTKRLSNSELSPIAASGPQNLTEASERPAVVPPVDVVDFLAEFPEKRKPIIQNLLRVGETMNVIGASKAGKSWLILSLLLAMAAGKKWLGRSLARGKVLLVDNELHQDELSSRITRALAAMELEPSDVAERFHVLSLRGQLVDIHELALRLQEWKEAEYTLIALDAFYRFLPDGVNENDNAQIANIYNVIDGIAARLDVAIVLNHHASKGDQSAKAVTDVGSGAGSISRAADTHLIVRPHELDGHAVLEGVCRSFPPIESQTIQYEYPLWSVSDIEPRVKRPQQQNGSETARRDRDSDEIVLSLIRSEGPKNGYEIRKATRWGKPRVDRTTSRLIEAGKLIARTESDGKKKTETEIFSIPETEI